MEEGWRVEGWRIEREGCVGRDHRHAHACSNYHNEHACSNYRDDDQRASLLLTHASHITPSPCGILPVDMTGRAAWPEWFQPEPKLMCANMNLQVCVRARARLQA